MATQERPIAYEPHPVTPERKKELIDKGFKIVDAKFKPKDAPAETKPAATVEELSAADMRAELAARGIEFPPHAKKADLAELLKAAE